jgi:hypothetical protein
MTTNEIRNRIAELNNEMTYIEFADRMSDEERKHYDELLRERNRLATKLYHIEHPTKEEVEEEEWFEPIPTREEEERKEKEREEADKRLTLKVWEAMKGTNWVGLPVIEKKIKEKGWM